MPLQNRLRHHGFYSPTMKFSIKKEENKMNIKKMLALAIIVLAVFSCMSAVSAGLFDFLSGDQFLQGDGSQVKIPSNYTVDDKKIAANCGDINITLTPQRSTDDKFQQEFFDALLKFGKDAGYENVTNRTVNGYTIHEFSAHPDKLKTINAPTTVEGSDEAWIEFTPELAAPFDNPVDHYRSVTYIKDGKEHVLLIFTNNSTVNLYNSEINEIVDSIAPMENK